MLTICILILIGLYFRKPIGDLVEKLKSVDWAQKFAALWQYVLPYAKKAGRVATKPVLQFYYVVTDSETSTLEKALIKDGFAKIIDKDLHTIVPFVHDGLYYLTRAEYDDYDDAETETSDYRRYRVGSGNGVIDKNGNVIIPAKYYMVRMVDDELFDVEVTYDGEHMLVNSQGQIVG